MLVNVYEEETRIALTENSVLVGLHFQQTNRERTAGNIYKGLVVKVNPAFQAAFVDYGEKRNGFLSSSDLNPSLFNTEGGRGRSRIQSILRAGQHVMVQVLKEGLREKGAALTTNLSLPGRYLVYTPNSDRSGVSRKIGDVDKRHQLKDILAGLVGDDGAGVIIRTAGIDRPAQDLKRDLAALKKEWTAIQERNARMTRPGLLHQEPGSIVRVLRDYFTDDVEEVWVDSPEAYQEALAYFKSTLPKFQKRLKLYVGEVSLFAAHNAEEQIEALGHSRVPLKSGGSIVIESTEALVSIDVNSGKSNQESDIEDTALRTNLEAAKEVARQLRLRNLGGLIVVDFIDMFQAKNRSKVVQALTDALRFDKARTSLGSISQFGLLEMSRQRIDMELSLGLRHKCEACNGTGSVPTLQAYANNLLRKIRALAASHRYAEIQGELPMEHANYMLNQKRESLRDLELEFDLKIHLVGNPTLLPAHAVRLTGKSAEAVGSDADGRTSHSRAALAEEEGAEHRRRRRGRGRGRDLGPPLPAELGGPAHADSQPGGGESEDLVDGSSGYVDELEEAAQEGAPFARGPDRHRQHGSRGASQPGAMDDGYFESNGEPQEGRLISPGIPSGNGSGAIQFSSTHRITDPDIVQVADPPRRRAVSPFREVAPLVEDGVEIFASAHRGPTGELVIPGIPMPVLPPPSARQEPQDALDTGGLHESYTGRDAPELDDSGTEPVPADEESSQADSVESEESEHARQESDLSAEGAPEDVAVQHGARPEGQNQRGRRRRSRGRSRGRGGSEKGPGMRGGQPRGGQPRGGQPRWRSPHRADSGPPVVGVVQPDVADLSDDELDAVSGNVQPPPEGEPEEVNGNVRASESGTAGRALPARRRRRRGRGRAGRPSAAGAV